MLHNHFRQLEKNNTVANGQKEIVLTPERKQTNIFQKNTANDIFIKVILEYAKYRNQFHRYDALLEDWLVDSYDGLKEKIQELQKKLNSPYEKMMNLLESIKEEHSDAKNILDEAQCIKNDFIESVHEDEIDYNYDEDEDEDENEKEQKKQNNIFLKSILFVPLSQLEDFFLKMYVEDLVETILKDGITKAKRILESKTSYSWKLTGPLGKYLPIKDRTEIINKAILIAREKISLHESQLEKQARSRKNLELHFGIYTSKLLLFSNTIHPVTSARILGNIHKKTITR